MAPNYSSDQALGEALREYFAAEAPSLRAPTNLWNSLEGRLEEPRRIPRIRRKVLAAASRYWFPAMATGGAVAAGAVLAVWATSANLGEAQVVEKIVTHRSQIREVPVETVVTREVIKEVPVETVVRKEVIKEVAVERIVTQEVIKEVVVEKLVERSSAAYSRAPTAQAVPAPTARPPATTFQDNRRQPVVATADDAVSTFSLDTDRTSYQLALTWAQQGYDIEPDSVRAEEWINAFNYQYAPPADDWGFAITSDLVAHPLEERKHLVRIGFQAAEVADDRPLNVTLVLDASGSMGDGNRVDIARAAAETIRQSLRLQDRVAVVHFTTDVIHQY